MKLMSGLDARFLYSETSRAYMHTLKIAVVDISGRSDDLSRAGVVEALEARLERMPLLRQRVVPIPFGLGNPVVIDDPDFDLHRHIRVEEVRSPGGSVELDALLARIAAVPLPRDRPLWEMVVVTGLASGHVALVVKVHHALADGVAAVALLGNALADDDDAVLEAFSPEPLPTRGDLYRSAAAEVTGAVRSLPGFVRHTATGIRNERRARREETEAVMGPFAGPRTPFNVALTADRTFATLTMPLSVLAAARPATGGSLNDLFLSVCAGGIRRYLDRMGELPEKSLVASVPIATLTGIPRLAGNHVDNLFLPLHTELADPLDRATAIHAASVAARHARVALGPDLFEERAGLVPPALYGATMHSWAATRFADHVRPPLNLVASCVPGPRELLERDGGVITALYSSGPILEGIGLNITAWSYADAMYVLLLGCSHSLPDPWVLADDITAEMEELRCTAT